jgi:hypothetical protein
LLKVIWFVELDLLASGRRGDGHLGRLGQGGRLRPAVAAVAPQAAGSRAGAGSSAQALDRVVNEIAP